jgi:hypothetical protein
MAKVETFKVKKGEMFGGKGVALFRPLQTKQYRSETSGLTPEEPLALAAEQSLMRLVSQNLPQNTENPKKAQ